MSREIKKQYTNLSDDNSQLNLLYERVSSHIDIARNNIAKTIDTEMVKAYWLSGRDIVIEEQAGKKRAGYGKRVIMHLSAMLQKKYGSGFSDSTLLQMRKFFLVYQSDTGTKKPDALRTESDPPKFLSHLGWTHYRILMRIENPEARKFYEIEADKNAWSYRVLQRQVNTLLYERLAMSKDKQGLINLATKGQHIEQPKDIIKEPIVLEFIGVHRTHQMTESKLETARIGPLVHHYFANQIADEFKGRIQPGITYCAKNS